MVENTNSTTLEVQGSFALTYMVGFISLNLRSQEMDKGVPHARARCRRPGRAWRGGEAGRQPTYGVTRQELADSWHNSARAGRLLA
jgi:hypothetical protein